MPVGKTIHAALGTAALFLLSAGGTANAGPSGWTESVSTAAPLTTVSSGALDGEDRYAAGSRADARQLPSRAPVGILSETIARLDPLTLEPGSNRFELGEFHETWSYSPDRSRIALGMGSPSNPVCGAGVCILDSESMSLVGDIDGPIAAEAVGWVGPRRIVAVLQTGQVIVADPETGETLPGHDLSTNVYGPPSASIPGGFAVLVGGDSSRLATFDSEGDMRVARLKRIPSVESRHAGLAADPTRRRAYVVADQGPVAEVNLKTMDVRYHGIKGAARRGAAPKGPPASRCASWLGRGRLALASGGADSQVGVLDTEAWRMRTVNGLANQATSVGNRLVVYRSFEQRGVGLRIYSHHGQRLQTHLFKDEALNVQVAGGYAYAISSRRLRVVHVGSGKVVRDSQRHTARDVLLLSSRLGSGYQCGH